jgi:hypothetical protein
MAPTRKETTPVVILTALQLRYGCGALFLAQEVPQPSGSQKQPGSIVEILAGIVAVEIGA